LEVCRDFYSAVLGWPIVDEWNRAPLDRGALFGIGDTRVEILASSDAAATKFDPSLHLLVWEEALESLSRRLQAAGSTVGPIQVHPWGHRSFVTNDPSGLTLKFFSQAG